MDIDYQKKNINLQNLCKKQQQTIAKLQAEIRERCQSYLLHTSQHRKINCDQQSKDLDKSQSPKRKDNNLMTESIVRVYEQTIYNGETDEMIRSNIIGDKSAIKNKNINFAIFSEVNICQKGIQVPIAVKQEINVEEIHQSYKLRISKIQEERNKYVKDLEKKNSELSELTKKTSDLQRKLFISMKNENKNKSKIEQFNMLDQGLASIYRKMISRLSSKIHREVKAQFQSISLKQKLYQISHLFDNMDLEQSNYSNILQKNSEEKTGLIQIINGKSHKEYIQQICQTQLTCPKLGCQYQLVQNTKQKCKLNQQSQCEQKGMVKQKNFIDEQSQYEIKLSQNSCNTENKIMSQGECQSQSIKKEIFQQKRQVRVKECQNCVKLADQIVELRQTKQVQIEKEKDWNPQFIVLKQIISKTAIDSDIQTESRSDKFRIQQLVPLNLLNSNTEITRSNLQQQINLRIQQNQLKFKEQKEQIKTFYQQQIQFIKSQQKIEIQGQKQTYKQLQGTLQITRVQLNQLQQQNLSLIAQSMQKQNQIANLKHLLQKHKKQLEQSNLNVSKYMQQLEYYKEIQNNYEKTKQQLDKSRSIIDDLQSSKLSREAKDLKDSHYQNNQSNQKEDLKKSSLKVGQRLQQPYYIQEQLQSDPNNQYVKRSFIRKKIVRRNLSATAYRIVSKSKEQVDAIVKSKVHEYADKSRQKKQKLELSNKKVNLKTLMKDQRISEVSEQNRESDIRGEEGKVVKIIQVITTTPNQEIKTAKIYTNHDKDRVTLRKTGNG